MMNLDILTIKPQQSIKEALEKINHNKKGFLIVVEKNFKLKGTLSDGDIRRGLIGGYELRDSLELIYNANPNFISINDSLDNIVNIFKSPSVKFLPIVDKEKTLVNVITKASLQAMLLLDQPFDFSHDFSQVDESILDHEIYPRPWGFYKTTFINNYSQAKIIKVEPHQQLSLQKHNHREEYWVIIHGHGEVIIEESVKILKAGDFVFIPKGSKHRLKNLSEKDSLMIAEVQLGDYFGEDDIVRYHDIYNRY